MKPAPFAYAAPRSLDEALALLAEHGDEAQILAGGQSLVPMLALRLATPGILVDINRIAGLPGLEESDAALTVGPCVRHAELLRHGGREPRWSLIAEAVREVAHPGIRNRGTLCGSLALADPAAEAPAYALALGAEIVLSSLSGERRIPAGDFFRGVYETARTPNEMITAVTFPRPSPGWRFGFQEIARRRGDYAIAGLCAGLRLETGRIAEAKLVFFGVAERPMRATRAERALLGEPHTDSVKEAAAAASVEIEVQGTGENSAALKRHLVAVLTERVLAELIVGDPRA
jgi:aerobic carbon-monoxide dehydrogenase medium subunit